MKVLIFGAGGQVGRALVAAAPTGRELIALTHADCDVAVRSAVEQAIEATGPDLVFNAAAYTAVDQAEAEPERAATLNAAAPGWIAAAAASAGARTIHISTDFVFAGNACRPILPDDAPRPSSVYGRTKLAGEAAVAAADPMALIVRTAWIYDAAGSNFVRTMLRLMGERDRLTIVADQVGTPTYARCLASAVWTLADQGVNGLHHFTDAGLASWYDFAVAIQEEALSLGLLERAAEILPIRTEDYPTPAVRPAYSVLDKTSTWALLPAPPPHWRVNLRACLGEIARNG